MASVLSLPTEPLNITIIKEEQAAVFFDFLCLKKRIGPLIKLLIEAVETNTDMVKLLSQQAAERFTQTQKMQKELALQVEELYECVAESKPKDEDDIKPLVYALIALREEIEHMRAYMIKMGDEDMKRQVELFILISDRKLSEAYVRKIERVLKPYDPAMDVAAGVYHAPGMEPNTILEELAGCYMYRGTIVKRAEVILAKGETHG